MNKTISYKSAKQLHETAEKYGVELPNCEKIWYVLDCPHRGIQTEQIIEGCEKDEAMELDFDSCFPAYDAHELMEWLPNIHVYTRNVNNTFVISSRIFGSIKKFHQKNLPHGLCKLAIYLIENKLI